MNKNLYSNIVFLVVGTFILAVMGIVVSLNFFKDSRLFEPMHIAAAEENSVKPTASNAKSGTEDYGTFKYERAKDAVVDKTDYGEAIPKPKKLKVEVLNYTSNKKVLEEIKTTLEESGFEVSAKNEKVSKGVDTVIIDRNDKKASAAVQKVLKGIKAVKWNDPKYPFDVTIKIGNDYIP